MDTESLNSPYNVLLADFESVMALASPLTSVTRKRSMSSPSAPGRKPRPLVLVDGLAKPSPGFSSGSGSGSDASTVFESRVVKMDPERMKDDFQWIHEQLTPTAQKNFEAVMLKEQRDSIVDDLEKAQLFPEGAMEVQLVPYLEDPDLEASQDVRPFPPRNSSLQRTFTRGSNKSETTLVGMSLREDEPLPPVPPLPLNALNKQLPSPSMTAVNTPRGSSEMRRERRNPDMFIQIPPRPLNTTEAKNSNLSRASGPPSSFLPSVPASVVAEPGSPQQDSMDHFTSSEQSDNDYISRPRPPSRASPAPEQDDGDYRSLKSSKKKRHLSDLSTWASTAHVPSLAGPKGQNYPAWSTRSGPVPASETARMFEEIEFSLKSILSPKIFKEFIRDPLGRHRFREYLMTEGDASDLDLWLDLTYHAKQMEEFKSASQALYDLYLSGNALNGLQLPRELAQEMVRTIRPHLQPTNRIGFDTAQQHLLDRLYNNQFQRYMKHKIIQECKVQLGRQTLTDADQEGLGDCFCLTNPRLPDHPVVLVSDGFVDVTGYPRSEIVGRNCRFLQGPATSPQSVQRIRDGLNSGEGCTELILNYRRNGEPFYCLLCIIPLRDATESIAYFIGGQVNVTGFLMASKTLGFLLPDGGGTPSPNKERNFPSLSPAMMRYKEMHPTGGKSPTTPPTPYSRGGPIPPVPILDASYSSSPGASGSNSAQSQVLRQKRYQAAGYQQHDAASELPPPAPRSAPSLRESRSMGFLGRLFKKGAPSMHSGSGGEAGRRGQLLTGAENTFGMGSRPLEDQIDMFKDLYQKVIVFKKHRREITFVTKHLLAFLGLPRATKKDLYSSILIHADLLAVLTGHDKTETKSIRSRVKSAIDMNRALSIPCGIKFLGRGKGAGVKNKWGVLHMAPLKDLDNSVLAFVGIFSSS